MYPPPQVLETEVFATVPDSLRLDRPSWMQRHHLRAVDSFLEGPGFDRAGNLYMTELAHGRILRLSPAGAWDVVAEYDGRPNGLRIRNDGAIFVTDRLRGIVRLHPENGEIETILPELPTAKLHGPNDLVIARNGDIYFTDQGETGLSNPTGRLVRLTAAGEAQVLLDTVPSPNGLALTADESALLLAVTRANAIWHVPLLGPERMPGRVGTYIQMSGGPGGGPDGILHDADDNLVVAHARMGAVWVFSLLGEPLYRLRSCTGRMTTNIAFGGADRHRLFITESATGTILTARLPTPGRDPGWTG
ncbi:MAG: SMP-30/gluconolactonase/LRE family protein [Rhodospirillales bacterium]|nr:SMP-30/gluconolactonase/LRE family protein [Rhodospirillales bacterium]